MTFWDGVNAGLEMMAVTMLVPTILKAWKAQKIVGVHWVTPTFFMLWSYWNLFWYPHLGQFWSFVAALVFAVCNSIWAYLVYTLSAKE